MNPTAEQRRIRDYEDAFGPCTCETYGWCALCVALRACDTTTLNAAATGPWSAFITDDDDGDASDAVFSLATSSIDNDTE